MDREAEEFYTAVGFAENRCQNRLVCSILDTETREVLVKEVEITCGIVIASTGHPGAQCKNCEKFCTICTCGNGVRFDSMADPTLEICSNDVFCRLDKMTPAYLNKLEEEEDFGDEM